MGEATAEYLTDDCDLDENTLEIFMGGNGDYYVGVRFRREDGLIDRRAVRVTTSGQRNSKFMLAISDAYRALLSGG